jgi:hypothetical protein
LGCTTVGLHHCWVAPLLGCTIATRVERTRQAAHGRHNTAACLNARASPAVHVQATPPHTTHKCARPRQASRQRHTAQLSAIIPPASPTYEIDGVQDGVSLAARLPVELASQSARQPAPELLRRQQGTSSGSATGHKQRVSSRAPPAGQQQGTSSGSAALEHI